MWIKQHWHMPQALQNAGLHSFDDAMRLQGKVFREVPGRKTMQIALGEKSYFIKQHFGVGWGEIIKSLLSAKPPILGAMTEVAAIQKLDEIGIATTPLVAYGQQGCNPANMRSFVMTEDLGDIVSLEDLAGELPTQTAEFKQKMIIAMAQLASKLHAAGLCHRDFYLCHFALKKHDLRYAQLHLYLVDLHRMLQHQPSNGSAVMKDIAGLYFSSQQCGLTLAELQIFKQHYLPQSERFWAQVEARSKQLLNKYNSKKFQQRLSQQNAARD